MSLESETPDPRPKNSRIKTMTRAILFSLCCVALLTLTRVPATAEQDLGIGSIAPPLDIEHWIQDGNGFFKPVEKFQKDKVYVVEFWATWCGPCINSMPHLAELQNKFRGRDVQIISVSDESVAKVQELLRQDNPQEGKTFSEITSAYSLTTDPDRSVHIDYMEGANQQGIPTSFIVGKSGQIEWIGHPMELDEPLEKVVSGTWDREEYKKTYKAQADFELAMNRLSMLAGAGKFDEAIKLVEREIKTVEVESVKIQWIDTYNGLKITTGNIDDDVVAYYREHIEEIKEDPIGLSRFGYMLYGTHKEGNDIGPLGADVTKAIMASQDKAPDEAAPFIQNTLAQLLAMQGKFKEAIEAQEKSIAGASERQKTRLMPFLEELKEKASKNEKPADEEK